MTIPIPRPPVWLLALYCPLASAAVPATGDYACHVRIAGDKPAIVLLEASSREHAARMALRATVRAADGTRAHVQEVLECIDRRQAHFQDAEAAKLFEQHGL